MWDMICLTRLSVHSYIYSMELWDKAVGEICIAMDDGSANQTIKDSDSEIKTSIFWWWRG